MASQLGFMPQAAGFGESVVGVISDTHGLLRPEALTALAGSDRIIHAGDLGKSEILEGLARVAPTSGIRGNVDRGTWAEAFPETLTLTVAGVALYVLHDLNTLDFDPADREIAVVVSGHSHQPRTREQAGVLYLNPGSAGPRRFALPITVARLKIHSDAVQVEIIDVLTNEPVETRTVARRKTSA